MVAPACPKLPDMFCCQVDIAQSVAKQFQKETASVVFFGALHSVHCLNRQVPLLGSAEPHDAALVQPNLNLQVC